MKQLLTWILEGFFLIIVLIVSLLLYAPQQGEQIMHIKMIQVTDKNKEKAIEQGSLMFVKTFSELEQPKNNTLISFQADRFGESVILTHMFVKSEVRNQTTYYITQAPDSSYYDTYETTHEDLIGTYLFHMQYMGNVYEFLQSTYGKLTYGIITGICVLASLYVQITALRRDRKKKTAEKITEQARQEEEELQEIPQTKQALPDHGETLDIQVNKLEQKILAEIEAGTQKKEEIPAYQLKEIREALGKRNEIVAEENVEPANSKPEQGTACTVVEETARAASEKSEDVLDSLLEEELLHEQRVASARLEEAAVTLDDEEIQSETQAVMMEGVEDKVIQTAPEILQQEEAVTEEVPVITPKLETGEMEAVTKNTETKETKEAEAKETERKETEIETKETKTKEIEIKEAVQGGEGTEEPFDSTQYPKYDTPEHRVPQVVVYPTDCPKDIEGLYNSDASKFEKNIPFSELQLHILKIDALEPIVNSIQPQDAPTTVCDDSDVPQQISQEAEAELIKPLENEQHPDCGKEAVEEAKANAITDTPQDHAAGDIEPRSDVDPELLEEVRREVQELLHGVKPPKEIEEQEYPDFNRKYAVKSKTDEKEKAEQPEQEEQKEELKEDTQEELLLRNLTFDFSGRFAILHGEVVNHLPYPVHYIKAEIELYDDVHYVIKKMKWYLCSREFLQPGEAREFTYTAYEIFGVHDYHLRIISYKRK